MPTPIRTSPACGRRAPSTEIPADAKTMVLFAALNRDPELWDDPDSFRR